MLKNEELQRVSKISPHVNPCTDSLFLDVDEESLCQAESITLKFCRISKCIHSDLRNTFLFMLEINHLDGCPVNVLALVVVKDIKE